MINSSSKKFVQMWPPWKTAWVFECLMTQSYNRNSQLRSLPSYNYYPTSFNITELWYLKAFQTKPLKALLRSLFPNWKNCAQCTTITKSWRICVIHFYWSNICKKVHNVMGCIAQPRLKVGWLGTKQLVYYKIKQINRRYMNF